RQATPSPALQRPGARSARPARCPPIAPQTNPHCEDIAMTIRTWTRRLFARPPRTIRKEPARLQPRLEELECRALLSVVAVSVHGGHVAITNSNPSDLLTLSQTTAGTITVADSNDFSVNGAAATPGPVTVPLTKNLTVTLNGGSDTVSFDKTTSIVLPG